MAPGTLPTPGKMDNGEMIGPCLEECIHIDCVMTKKMAASKCANCGEVIGYEVLFFTNPDKSLVHNVCEGDRVQSQELLNKMRDEMRRYLK